MNFKLLKSSWRPVFAWLFALFYFAAGATILAMVWLDRSKIDEVSGLLTAMVSSGAFIVTGYTVGRSWEKRHGQEQSEIETVAPPPGFGEGAAFTERS